MAIETIRIQGLESLSKRVFKGSLWVFALRFSNRGLGFIRTIILARLLAPSDFGLLGLAMLAIATLETLSQTGLQTAIIQKKEEVESYLDTAWTFSGVRAIVLFITLYILAPVISNFFRTPNAEMVIKVIAFSTLVSGFKNIGFVYFEKELHFKTIFIFEFLSTLVDLLIAITLAFILRNVWALVWGGVAGQCLRVFLSYILHPYRPSLNFEAKKFFELFEIGKWVLSSSIVLFFATQGDDIIVGKILGAAALGLYQVAYTFSNLPATEIAQIISKVTFPAYSKLQDDLQKLKQGYLKVLKVTTLISSPLTGVIILLAPDFTLLFFGYKWMPAVPAMRILALSGFLRSVISTMSPVFFSLKRPDISVRCQIIRMILLATFIFPLTMKWDILGASYAVFISLSGAFILFSIRLIGITGIKLQEFSKLILTPILGTAIMLILIEVIRIYFRIDTMGKFGIVILFVVAFYFLYIIVLNRFFNYGISKLIKEF
jgi:lipopolysaccharide exporter